MLVSKKLSVEPQDMFRLMRSTKISGVFDKIMIIWSEADDALGNDFVFDYAAKLDGLDPSKGECLMRWGGPVIRLAANPKIMDLVSRLMDIQFIRKFLFNWMKQGLITTPVEFISKR